eukprot:scaffold489_cov259-Pinguiococcus_pyrenoidosus.AAC.33
MGAGHFVGQLDGHLRHRRFDMRICHGTILRSQGRGTHCAPLLQPVLLDESSNGFVLLPRPRPPLIFPLGRHDGSHVVAAEQFVASMAMLIVDGVCQHQQGARTRSVAARRSPIVNEVAMGILKT